MKTCKNTAMISANRRWKISANKWEIPTNRREVSASKQVISANKWREISANKRESLQVSGRA